MAAPPPSLADAPAATATRDSALDALSDVLRALRICGGIYLDAAFTAPWCVASRVSPDEFRQQPTLPTSVVAFHYVIEGSMLVHAEGAAPVEVRTGQMVLLPRNDPHLLASDAGLQPADPAPEVREVEGGLKRMEFGG